MNLLPSLLFACATLASVTAFCQNNDGIEFNDPIDTITVEAKPIGGYDHLRKTLQQKINEGDTLGEKYRLDLRIIRFKVTAQGDVDSVTMINHMAGCLHRRTADELKKTKWSSARNQGNPVDAYLWLSGSLYFTKAVYRSMAASQPVTSG